MEKLGKHKHSTGKKVTLNKRSLKENIRFYTLLYSFYLFNPIHMEIVGC